MTMVNKAGFDQKRQDRREHGRAQPTRQALLTRAQILWALAAVVPLLFSIALLGAAASSGVMLGFAIGWLAIQFLGYGGSLKLARGDTSHPLFIAQVALNYLAFWLLAALFAGAISR